MIERPIPKGKPECTHPGCISGWIRGNPNGTPMEALPSPCPVCKGKGYLTKPQQTKN